MHPQRSKPLRKPTSLLPLLIIPVTLVAVILVLLYSADQSMIAGNLSETSRLALSGNSGHVRILWEGSQVASNNRLFAGSAILVVLAAAICFGGLLLVDRTATRQVAAQATSTRKNELRS